MRQIAVEDVVAAASRLMGELGIVPASLERKTGTELRPVKMEAGYD